MPVKATADEAVPTLCPPHLHYVLLSQPSSYSYSPVSPAGTRGLEWLPSSTRQHATHRSSSSAPKRTAPTASGAPFVAEGDGSRSDGGRSASSSGRSIDTGRPWRTATRAAIGGSIGFGAGGAFCGPAKADWLRLWPFPSRRRVVSGEPETRKRVLIMMSETGGGHKASAEALRQAIHELYGEDAYEVVVVDMWKQHTPPPFSNMPDSYSFLVKHSFLWRFTYEFLQPRAVHMPYFTACHALIARHLAAAFDTYQPDLVVSVHPLMQHIPLRILAAQAKARGLPRIPFATVVTDFTTCHNTWFHRRVTRCFVPTEYAAQLARRMGLGEGQIVVHGLPIRPVFSKRLPPRVVLRRRLGIQRDLPAVLLVGGGEGMGALEATVNELDAALGSKAQVVVICGRNRKLLAHLRSRAPALSLHVVAEGFVNNLHEYMAACDMIITKAGPGTIAEALISGLPILLNGNVPCQEEGNIPYVVDNGAGAFETDPAKIAAIVADWLGPSRAAFEAMAARAKALGRPEAVYHIAEDLAALATEGARLAADAAASVLRNAAAAVSAAAPSSLPLKPLAA